MRNSGRRCNRLTLALSAVSVAALWAGTGHAQAQSPAPGSSSPVQLPGISVTAPTPIMRAPPPRPVAAQPGTTGQDASPPAAFTPPPGLVEQVFVPLTLVPSQEILARPLIIVPIANHDNNQHSHNENLRLENLWAGMETMAVSSDVMALPSGAVERRTSW